MDCKILRTDYTVDGIFGELFDDKDSHICYTLEHAYDARLGDGSYIPKIPNGVYVCSRGMHRLKSMNFLFETFELQNVPGHTNILLHQGNYNNDSEGCILLGTDQLIHSASPMVTKSRKAFDLFMSLEKNINAFNLTIMRKI